MYSVVVPPARFVADLLYIFPELEYHEKELCMQSAGGLSLRRRRIYTGEDKEKCLNEKFLSFF